MVNIPKITVGGLPIGVLSRQQWCQAMLTYCKQATKSQKRPFIVFSVNGQVVAKSSQDAEYRKMILQADALDADGQPLVWASRLLTRNPLPERVATTDLFGDAAKMAEANGLRFYLLGSNQKNLTIALTKIKSLYPNLIIAGHRNGYFKKHEEPSIVQHIQSVKTDVLWVGLGVPKQEEFVLRNRNALTGVSWIKTCGGLFDYFTPSIKRAPAWMQKLCLEWLFRTIQEPRKYFWRYFTTNSVAAWILLTRTKSI